MPAESVRKRKTNNLQLKEKLVNCNPIICNVTGVEISAGYFVINFHTNPYNSVKKLKNTKNFHTNPYNRLKTATCIRPR